MPKPPATPEEIESIRGNMIREAVSLINEEGFPQFSMRRLGSRLGIAAKTIYNYFADKDELYLMILTSGFDELLAAMEKARRERKPPLEQLFDMAMAYVRFGLDNPHHYNILFSLDVPKYIDYVGTRHEALADQQNRQALQVAALAREVMVQAARKSRKVKMKNLDRHLMGLWSTLHGIVSLASSRVTLEVGDFTGSLEAIVREAVDQFK